jgi:hypothetical protein
MKKSTGFAAAAVVFGVSSVSFGLGRQFGLAAGMAGITFMYAALAYREKKAAS